MKLSKESKLSLNNEPIGLTGEVTVPENGIIPSFLTVGRQYIFRTVTMIYVGTLVRFDNNCAVITNAAWVAETADRWHKFVKGVTGKEVEAYDDGQEVLVFFGPCLEILEPTKKMSVETV